MPLAIALLALGTTRSEAQTPEVRQEIRRTLREYIFLNTQLGLRHRSLIYAEDSMPGPGGRSELRFYLNGRGLSSPGGPLSAYVGLGFVGRLGGVTEGAGDPLGDAYDDFALSRNVRLHAAHVEYVARDEDGVPSYSLTAGRMADFDRRSHLLLYDGARARFALSKRLAVDAYGGRRSILDGHLPDDRSSAGAQLVAGGGIEARFQDLTLSARHRFEEIHRGELAASFAPSDTLSFDLGAELVFGGNAALEATGAERGTATVVRFGADVRDARYTTALLAIGEVQIGDEPLTFGRGGRGPEVLEIEAAASGPLSEAKLDRLFLGPDPAHASGEVLLERWLTPIVALHVGAYGRMPLASGDISSLRPRLIELWAGPELLLGSGHRVGVETRASFEDPGDPVRVFEPKGDGARRSLAGRVHAELPWALGETKLLTLRPEVEGVAFESRGPLSETEGQTGINAGLLASLKIDQDLRVAGRYGLATLPAFGADSVRLVHDLEVWIGGTY